MLPVLVVVTEVRLVVICVDPICSKMPPQEKPPKVPGKAAYAPAPRNADTFVNASVVDPLGVVTFNVGVAKAPVTPMVVNPIAAIPNSVAVFMVRSPVKNNDNPRSKAVC